MILYCTIPYHPLLSICNKNNILPTQPIFGGMSQEADILFYLALTWYQKTRENHIEIEPCLGHHAKIALQKQHQLAQETQRTRKHLINDLFPTTDLVLL